MKTDQGNGTRMKTSSRRTISLLLTFAMVCAMTVGIATSAFAATININVPGDWPTSHTITLNNGDVLNIAAGAGSPSAETVINIAADANVTINGNGSLINNLSIAESEFDTTSHTVTIKDLMIESTAYNVYKMYRGTLVLEGDNEFNAIGDLSVPGNGYGIHSTGSMPAVNITSSTGGTLTINAKLTGLFAGNTCTISGDAQVTTTGRSGAAIDYSLTVASGASLTSTSTNPTLSGIQNAGYTVPVVYNSGTIIATAGTGAQAIYCIDIYMAEDATTTLYNGMTTPEAHIFHRLPTVPTGYIWKLTGTAEFSTTADTPDSEPATIIVPATSSGTIQLVLLAPPTITGPTAQTVTEGYTATSTSVFTVTGTAPVVVTKVSGDPAITWNPTTMKLDIAPGLAPGTYTVKLKASNGVDPDAYTTFTLTVVAQNGPPQPPKPPALIPPSITGPKTLTVKKGYKKTSTGVYTVKGTKPVTVKKVSGNKAITWNDKTKKLDIGPGLAPGTYVVVLKASNGVDPDAYITFTLTVTAPKKKATTTTPLGLPSTGDSALHVSWFMLGIVGVFGVGAFALIDKRRLAWLEIKN